MINAHSIAKYKLIVSVKLAMIKSTYVGQPQPTQTNRKALEKAYKKQKAESLEKAESLLSSCFYVIAHCLVCCEL